MQRTLFNINNLEIQHAYYKAHIRQQDTINQIIQDENANIKA